MPVRCLTNVLYGESGKDWHLEKTFNPRWDEIVTSINRLDKFYSAHKGAADTVPTHTPAGQIEAGAIDVSRLR